MDSHQINNKVPASIHYPINFLTLLNNLIEEEIYALCTEGSSVIRGVLLYSDYNRIILNNEKGKQEIPLKNIEAISPLKMNSNVSSLEAYCPSNCDSSFFEFLNKQVVSLSSQAQWGYCGLLTYIGSDFITILNSEDNVFYHITNKGIRSMATSWEELKI